MQSSHHYLMCAPNYFEVSYIINPWMEGNINQTCLEKACDQWQRLRDLVEQRAEVSLVIPQPGLPDMPFTANAGLIVRNHAVLSRFRHAERQKEEEFFADWFINNHYDVIRMPSKIPFEGAGDALFDAHRQVLWMGYGNRTSPVSHTYLSELLDLQVLSLCLTDARFFHLDTCFCPLSNGYVLYYPQAFDESAQQLIAEQVPEEKRIVVAEPDALNFACNAINIGSLVILSQASAELKRQLAEAEFEVVESDMSEFRKAGGSAKCLTLQLQ